MSIIDYIGIGLTTIWQGVLVLLFVCRPALIIFAGVIALIIIVLAYYVDRLKGMRIP